MKRVGLADMRDHFSQYVREAGKEHTVITRHGRPAGVLIGFETEDEGFEYRIENDPRFLERIAAARASLRAGKGIPWEEIEQEEDAPRRKPSARKGRR